MTVSRKLETFILAAMLLVLPAYGPSFADQIKGPAVSAGAASTEGGSLLNVGQAAIGRARSASHTMNAGVIPVIVSFVSQRIRGDLDLDGDADLDDHAIFTACMNGPDVNTPPSGCTQEQFDLADLHADQHVDMRDYEDLLDAILAQ